MARITLFILMLTVLVGLEVCGKHTERVNRGRRIIKALGVTKGDVRQPKLQVVEKTTPQQPSPECEGVKCGPGEQCKVTAEGKTTCICTQECHDRIRLICASDGVTYTNKCEMRRLACQRGTRVSAVHEGMCAPMPTDPSTTVGVVSDSPVHPIACYQDQRDALQRNIVEWLLGRETREDGGVEGDERVYETVLSDCFARFDETEDALLDPNEFLKFVEQNQTLHNSTGDLNRDIKADTLLRGLCIDALLAGADSNFDWRLSLTEFKAAMMPDFSPPTKKCSLNGNFFQDGEQNRNNCNFCVCACGSWVCTGNACIRERAPEETDTT
ncbi:follistatin-related protein 1-like [Asterias rubens]|uniref:follistatin-related protein 1-like n=1 Tax=Asterias rubens TaxID=7604 RepID=UPI001454E72A|nr:follistatin-related protein 1-like [Asterias rubens]